MQKKKIWVEWEDGADLSKSRKKPGQYSPLTRQDDTNRLGHFTLSDVDEDDDEGGSVTYKQFASRDDVHHTADYSRPPRRSADCDDGIHIVQF